MFSDEMLAAVGLRTDWDAHQVWTGGSGGPEC
jgi:hypothetical protein